MANKTCHDCVHCAAQTVIATCPACGKFVPKPMTNGDVIRQGGDDALMEFKKKHKCDCCVYISNGNCTAPLHSKDRCVEGLKLWLNAPAESEVGR